MKKLYTIALATAVTFSAVAERQFASGSIKLTRTATIEAEAIQKSMPTAKMKALAKAVDANDIEAIDAWNYYGLLQNQGEGQQSPIEIKIIDSSTGEVNIIFEGDEDFTVKATFDAAKGTITIPNKQYMFTDADGDVYFYLKNADSEGKIIGGASSAEATVGTFANNTITFPELDIWAAGDPANERAGWYFLTYENTFVNDPFVSIGNGQFTENILYPLFNKGKENKTAATVEVLSDGQGTYKVIDPFKTLYSTLEITATSPELILNAKDPSNIMIELSSSGISSGTDGLYTYFSESWYHENFGNEDEVFGPAFKITKTVEGDNVTITIPYHATSVLAMTSEKLYYGSAFASTLTFKEATSSIGSIEIEDTNAPAVYYNLQGVQVENPSGFVIRIQGGKATKMYVK